MLKQRRISLSGIRVPVTFIAGRYDILTGSRDMLTASQRIPGSRFRELDASHFIPIEFPEVVNHELRDVIARALKAKTAKNDTTVKAAKKPAARKTAKKAPAPRTTKAAKA